MCDPKASVDAVNVGPTSPLELDSLKEYLFRHVEVILEEIALNTIAEIKNKKLR